MSDLIWVTVVGSDYQLSEDTNFLLFLFQETLTPRVLGSLTMMCLHTVLKKEQILSKTF